MTALPIILVLFAQVRIECDGMRLDVSPVPTRWSYHATYCQTGPTRHDEPTTYPEPHGGTDLAPSYHLFNTEGLVWIIVSGEWLSWWTTGRVHRNCQRYDLNSDRSIDLRDAALRQIHHAHLEGR